MKTILSLMGLLISGSSLGSTLTTLTIKQVMDRAVESNEALRAQDIRRQARETELFAADLALAPQLNSEVGISRDQTVNAGSRLNRHAQYLELAVKQALDTGTELGVAGGLARVDVGPQRQADYVSTWEVSVTQALWRDNGGRLTQLRREQEGLQRRALSLEMVLKRQQLFFAVEQNYWRLAEAMQREQLMRENIARSETLESWIRGRIERSAAEKVDLIQVQALTAQRRIDLTKAQDQVRLAREQLGLQVPGLELPTWEPDLAELGLNRDLVPLLAEMSPGSKQRTPESLEAVAGQQEVDRMRLEIERIQEASEADLRAFARHGHSGAREQVLDSWGDALGPKATASSIGLQLSMILDADLLQKQESAARLQAAAAELDLVAAKRRSVNSWAELQRRVLALQERLGQVQQWVTLKTKLAREEKKRFELGRSTAFQVITFEAEAAGAALELSSLNRELRQLESQARLFGATAVISQPQLMGIL